MVLLSGRARAGIVNSMEAYIASAVTSPTTSSDFSRVRGGEGADRIAVKSKN